MRPSGGSKITRKPNLKVSNETVLQGHPVTSPKLNGFHVLKQASDDEIDGELSRLSIPTSIR